MPELSIIIVTYNVRHFLEHCIDSVYQAVGGLSYEIFVVDNNSTDGTEILFSRPRPHLTFIRNTENTGFSRANNQAIRQSTGTYVLLLNPDTVVTDDTFTAMISFMEARADAGAAGCKILNPDGTLQAGCRRSFPTPRVSFYRLSGLGRLFPRSRRFNAYNLTYLPEDETAEVDAISGSFMMVKREVIDKAGMLDEEFFMYGEDLDWCFRIREKGYKIYYVPATRIIHFKGESSRHQGFRNLRSFYQAMHIFVRKHYKSRYFFLSDRLFSLAIFLRGTADVAGRILRRLWIPLLDVAVLNAAMLLGYYIRFQQVGRDLPYAEPRIFLMVHAVVTLVWLFSFQLSRVYSGKQPAPLRSLYGVTLGFIISSSIPFFFKNFAFSRLAALYTWGIGTALVCGWRVIALALLKTSPGRRLRRKRTLIIGDPEKAGRVHERIRSHAADDYRFVGVIDDNEENLTAEVADIRVIGTTAQLPRLVREFDIQQILVAPAALPYEKIMELTTVLKQERVQLTLVSAGYDTLVSKPRIESLGELPMIDADKGDG